MEGNHQGVEILSEEETPTEKIFSFVTELNKAYKEIRFENVPAMVEAHEAGETESIAEHMWSVQVMWDSVQASMPNALKANVLRRSIDTEKVSKMLRIHDIGEIYAGDITRHDQIDGNGGNRKENEFLAFKEITSDLPDSIREEYKELFYDYEVAPLVEKSAEAVIANLVDSMHGDMRFFNKATLSPENVERAQAIIMKYTKPYISELFDILVAEGNSDGFYEFKDFVEGYCRYATKKGYPLDVGDFLN